MPGIQFKKGNHLIKA